MNVFVSDLSPVVSAHNLDNKRVVKMTLESCQILSTVMHLNGLSSPMKPCYIHHPVVKWATSDSYGCDWLITHFQALVDRYALIYGKEHKCEQYLGMFKSQLEYKMHTPVFWNSFAGLSFCNCTPFKDIKNTVEAYRKCLTEKWLHDKRPPKWTFGAPDWFMVLQHDI